MQATKKIIMKSKITFSILIVFLLLFSACIKNDPVLFTDTQAEFDAASWNANAAGLTYPLFTRVPGFGRATSAADPLITRTSGTIRVRVNLVGAKSKSDRTIDYTVFDPPITSVQYSTTITLAASPAVAGVHYTALPGTLTVPADSTWGYIQIPILNPGATAGQTRILGLELKTTSGIKAMENYNRIALSIDQR